MKHALSADTHRREYPSEARSEQRGFDQDEEVQVKQKHCRCRSWPVGLVGGQNERIHAGYWLWIP